MYLYREQFIYSFRAIRQVHIENHGESLFGE